MAAYEKFENFGSDLLNGKHDFTTDVASIKVYLTAVTPDPVNDLGKTDLLEITGTPAGYTNGGEVAGKTATPLSNQTGANAGKWDVNSVATIAWTSGETGTTDWNPFRYVVLYNDSITGTGANADRLIGCWDYGSNITLGPGTNATTPNGDSFTITFTGAKLFTVDSSQA